MNEPSQAMTLTAQALEVAAELRVWDAVVVIGAGTSVMSGLPLTTQLYALVYHAIDSAPECLDRVARALGCESASSGKELVGTDRTNLMAAFEGRCCLARGRGRIPPSPRWFHSTLTLSGIPKPVMVFGILLASPASTRWFPRDRLLIR